MANRTYSLYEAKAKFSEIIRLVRERGASATITYQGRPVAEIRPIEPVDVAEDRLSARMRELEASGELKRGNGERLRVSPVTHRKGALERFLADRE